MKKFFSKAATAVGKAVRTLLPKWLLGHEKTLAAVVGGAVTWIAVKLGLPITPAEAIAIGGVVTSALVWTAQNTGQPTP